MKGHCDMSENVTKFDYSRLDIYLKCPQQYKWKFVDFRTPKKPPNMYYALPGIVIQKLFEHFYNDAWYLKRGGCREFMYNRAAEIYEKTLKWCSVDWNSAIAKKTKSDVFDEFLDMIGPNLDLIKEKKLLSNFAKSEYTIQTFFGSNKYVRLKSKIDFLIKNEDGMQILDGKATSNKKNYLNNPKQLYFYAMMFYFKYGRYPDKLGYWWWRDASITYVDFNEENISLLKEEIDEVLYKIYKKKFEATPEYASCLFCPYNSECLEKIKHNAEKQASKSTPITQEDLDAFL